MDDYDIPFDGMSEDEFMYRAMNDDDPMYMGGPLYYEEEYDEDYDEDWDADDDEDYEDRVQEWYEDQLGKIWDAFNDYMADPDDDPRHYFDDITFDPFPEE